MALLRPSPYAKHGGECLVPGIHAFRAAAPHPARQDTIGQQLAAPLFIGFGDRYDHHGSTPAILATWLSGIAGKAFACFAVRRVPDIGFKLGDFAPNGIARPFR
jgi:hypothetical protein